MTVDTIYRELSGDHSPRDVPALFGRMAILDKRHKPERYAGACASARHVH